MTTIIDTIVFLVNVALSSFLKTLYNPQNAKMSNKANKGSTRSIRAFKKNAGVLSAILFTPAIHWFIYNLCNLPLSKKQSKEKAASADCETIDIES